MKLLCEYLFQSKFTFANDELCSELPWAGTALAMPAHFTRPGLLDLGGPERNVWGNGIAEGNSYWNNLAPKPRMPQSICMTFKIPILISETEMKFPM